MRLTKKLLDISGIGSDRLHVAWVSSAEAQRFAQVVTDVTRSIKDQGEFDTGAFELELEAAHMTLNGEIVRWLVGKEVDITTKGDVYGRSWNVEKLEDIMDNALEREYHKNLIYLAIKDGCKSVRDVNKRIGLDLQRISYLLSDMEKTNMVEFKGMEERKPVFAAI
jgi:hypothetical protein